MSFVNVAHVKCDLCLAQVAMVESPHPFGAPEVPPADWVLLDMRSHKESTVAPVHSEMALCPTCADRFRRFRIDLMKENTR
jgi:hypothetical protein